MKAWSVRTLSQETRSYPAWFWGNGDAEFQAAIFKTRKEAVTFKRRHIDAGPIIRVNIFWSK